MIKKDRQIWPFAQTVGLSEIMLHVVAPLPSVT